MRGRLAPGTEIAVRDSKDPDGPRITLTAAQFTHLIHHLKEHVNTQWRKSSHSGGISDQQCVELGLLSSGTTIAARDSEDSDGTCLTLPVVEFASSDRARQAAKRS